MNELLELDYSRLPGAIWDLLIDPTSNLAAALILYGIIGVLILIVALIVLMIVAGGDDDEDPVPAADAAAGNTVYPHAESRQPEPRRRRSARELLVVAAVVALLLSVAWVGTGYVTAVDATCLGCHATNGHQLADEALEPHVGVDCVRCHEPGGLTGRLIVDVPARIAHIADGAIEPRLKDDYGIVANSACATCHSAVLTGVVKNEDRGLRMSHAEPLQSSARCLDCHTFSGNMVASHDAGMVPCLKCHDAVTASADCATCHDRETAAAASPRTASFAKVQVNEVRCSSCHNEKQSCDPCHGTRMPHTVGFMQKDHARAATVDLWYNGGDGCAKCHTAERRPCQKCHTTLLGKGHPVSFAQTHQKASPLGCVGCHQAWAHSPQRDFCIDVCHTPEAMRYSPR